MTLGVLDLFSGIGGFSLGLERAGGFETVAMCEIDPFCRKVLRKYWPDLPLFLDVRTMKGRRDAFVGLLAGGTELPIGISQPVDVICGGFPCQDISRAGKGAGINGEKGKLWWEYHRLIGEIHPRYALIENVSALRSKGLDQVLGSLTALGYDAEWHCIPASAVGAPHKGRDRLFILAYPHEDRFDGPRISPAQWQGSLSDAGCSNGEPWDALPMPGDSEGKPGVRRIAYGVPNQLDRIGALGNAVIPQIVEVIGRAILHAEGKRV